MYENRFTPRAQSALRLAQEAAEELGHSYVGSEHLLLGLLRGKGSGASRLLARAAQSETPPRPHTRTSAAAHVPYLFHGMGRFPGPSSSDSRRWRVSDTFTRSIYSLYCLMSAFPFFIR